MFSLALFADAPRRFVSTSVSFYWAKLSYCFVYFLSSVISLLWGFPDVNNRSQPGDEYTVGGLGYVTTPITWSTYDKVVITISTLVLTTCIVFGFVYYIVRCLITQRVLKQLPYNVTRPVQISFHFYVSATFIWVSAELLFFVLAIVSGIIGGVKYTGSGDLEQTEADFFDRIVVGLDDIQYFNKHRNPSTILFGTLFTAIFQFFFSPPAGLGPVKTSKTHYDTEKEAADDRVKGRLGFRVPKSVKMILERARLLCICSREVYLPFEDEWNVDLADENYPESGDTGKRGKRRSLADSFIPKGIGPSLHDYVRIAGEQIGIGGGRAPTGSSFGAGCRVVAYLSEPKELDVHDTRAIIFRHDVSEALIIAFRGTLTMKQVKTDLMQHKVCVSLDTFLAITSKRERARRDLKFIVPDEVEKNILRGAKTKVNLFDLLHCDDDQHLPDYLQSSVKSRSGNFSLGIARIHFGFWSSYNRIRRKIHEHVRRELVSQPGPLFICG